MVKLFIAKPDRDTLCYGVKLWYRAFFMVFALVIFGGTWFSRDQVPFSWFSFPMVFSYFCVFAALYGERWVFDRSRNSVTHRYGVLLLARNHEYRIDDVSHLLLRQYRRGGLSSSQVRGGARRAHLSLQMVMNQGEPAVIEEISRRRSSGSTEHAAGEIARHIGVPLKVENLIPDIPLDH